MRMSIYCLLLLCAHSYAAGVYKCEGQSGKVVYQDTPCSTGKQRVLDDLPSNSIKGPPTREPTATPAPLVSTPTPAPIITSEPITKVDPGAPLTQNCSVDNPNRDPEFCRRKNLPALYPEWRPDNRPRPQPLRK